MPDRKLINFQPCYENRNTFQRSIKFLLIVGRFFSVIPVQGITKDDAVHLRFRYLTLPVLYFVITSAGFLVISIFCGLKTEVDGFRFNDTSLTFMLNALISNFLFFDLAKKWPKLATDWQLAELSTTYYGYPKHISTKIKAITIFVLIASLVEHILSEVKISISAFNCSDGSLSSWMQHYFVSGYPQVFHRVSYSHWKGLLLFGIHLIAVFIWNYMDLFIIVLSFCMAERFRLLSSRLSHANGQVMSESFWKQTREDYNRLSSLCKTLDKCISKIILLSFASNLYFICLQLFNSLSRLHDITDLVYFYFSFGYLLFRITSVSLTAASVRHESKMPAATLYTVPSCNYTMEVQRFLHQVTFDDIVLTGYNLFSVTRGLLLTIAGTIITYEIFLVQFNTINGGNTTNTTSLTCDVTRAKINIGP